MYTYKIWNKTDDINGVDSNVVLKNNPIYKKGDVVLIINTDSDRVEFIAIESELRESYKDKVSNIEKLAEIRCEYYNNNAPMTVIELQNKISILEAENEKLNTQLSTVRASHSDLILDLDFRVMDIEDNLGLVPMNINLFKALGEDDMNSTFMVVLDKIETGNYNSKEEIEGICDRYLARGRITGEEYDMLMKALDKKESEKNEVIPEI